LSGGERPGASSEVQGGFRRESSSAIRAKDARGSDVRGRRGGVAARDRLARRATRSRTVVPWQGRSWRDLRHGQAEASAGPTTGGRRITMQGNDVQSNDVWRWRPDAVSSLDPRGGGETLIARQVRRRSCGAKAAVRRDELGGGTHGELPLSVRRLKQEQRDAGPTRDAGLTAGFIHSRRHVRMQSNRLRTNRLRASDAEAKEGLALERMDPGGSRRS
jgi:hypothetical protein